MEKGSCILNSKPFAYVLYNSHRGRHCNSCLISNEKLLKCVSCSFVYYCNRKCQKKSWNLHKLECAAIKKVHPYVPTDSVRLMAQIIFKLKIGGAEESEDVGDGTKRKFEHLESHIEQIKADENRMMLFSKMIQTLKMYIGEDNLPAVPDLLCIFGKMVVNSLAVSTGDLRFIGVGLYLGLSRFNHSCKPNAVVNFEGTGASVRTIVDLPNHDLNQVFITYIDQVCNKSKRMKSLKEQYYFNCQCVACADPNRDAKITKVLKTEGCDIFIKKLTSIQDSSTTDDDLSDPELMKTTINNLKECEQYLSPMHHLRVKETETVFDCAIETSSWEQALVYGRKLIDSYKFYFGEYHPTLGITLMKLGKIELYLGNMQQAMACLHQAETIVRISYGKRHSIYGELYDLMRQCLM